MSGTGGPRQPRRRVGFALVAGLATLVPSVFAHAQDDSTVPTSSPDTSEVVPETSLAEPPLTTVPSDEPAPSAPPTTAPPAATAPPETTTPPTVATTVPPATTTTSSPRTPADRAATRCTIPIVLKWSNTGPFVTCLRSALRTAGYTLSGPDDYFDLSTVDAVKAYQATKGLPATGIANPQTLYRLGLFTSTVPVSCQVTAPLQVRASGATVQCLELKLALFGYWLAGPNTYFDNTTVVALQAFQRSRRLPATGQADLHTLHALGLAPPPPPPPPPPPTPCRLTAAVRLRDYGEPVRCLEARLQAIGYAIQGPNLYFDYGTFTAVQRYQRAIGASPDGVAGAYTLYKLGIWGGPTPSLHALPANSGTGRRVVYSRAQQRVWAVDANGVVVKTHRISGKLYEPRAGTYSVYSRSMYTYSASNPSIKWRYMVRFAYGDQDGRIGFHEIPTQYGRRLQTDAQLGQPLSGGCVRQSTPDAQWMWNWAYLGTKVVVL